MISTNSTYSNVVANSNYLNANSNFDNLVLMSNVFGQLVAELRAARKLKQSELAQLVSDIAKRPVGASTIGRIEKSAIPFSTVIGSAIIKALKPTPEQKAKLEKAMVDFLAEYTLKAPYSCGKTLAQIMSDLDITDRVVAEGLKVVPQAVQAWRVGTKLMSDDMLIAVVAFFSKRGASAANLRQLSKCHVYDVLYTMPRLKYMTKAQRRKLAEFGADLV